MPGLYSRTIAPIGTTGNNTHQYAEDIDAFALAAVLIVEAVGATPTLTWIVEGSFDNVNWFAMAYITDASDTAAFTSTAVTAVGAYPKFFWQSASKARFYKKFRIRTTLNTNVTYRAEIHFQERGE